MTSKKSEPKNPKGTIQQYAEDLKAKAPNAEIAKLIQDGIDGIKPVSEETAKAVENAAKEEKDPGFSDFMSSLSLEGLETIKSPTTQNVYVLMASKAQSMVGVSLTLEPKTVKSGDKVGSILTVVLRFLEIPGASGVSAFDNPGETRQYVRGGKKINVHMLTKLQLPLCPAQVSAWELGLHLRGDVRMEIAEYVQEVLTVSGCAINCKNKDEIAAVIFTRLDTLPEEATSYWEPLTAGKASAM